MVLVIPDSPPTDYPVTSSFYFTNKCDTVMKLELDKILYSIIKVGKDDKKLKKV